MKKIKIVWGNTTEFQSFVVEPAFFWKLVGDFRCKPWREYWQKTIVVYLLFLLFLHFCFFCFFCIYHPYLLFLHFLLFLFFLHLYHPFQPPLSAFSVLFAFSSFFCFPSPPLLFLLFLHLYPINLVFLLNLLSLPICFFCSTTFPHIFFKYTIALKLQ